MYFVLGLLIVLLSLYFIATPFLDDESVQADKNTDNDEKITVYSSLEDVEADYQMGKISEEDYAAVKAEQAKKNEVKA